MASKSLTNQHEIALTLKDRHRQTNEVKDVMTGYGFKKNKPEYTSHPDVQKTEIHHQVLAETDYRRHYDTIYGKQNNLRHLDPPMNEILAWGEFDPPTKNDFTGDKGAFQEKYKINKMGVEFISESQDNFRNP